MIVCICRGVDHVRLAREIGSGANTVDKLGDACGAGTGCGTCVPALEDLIELHSGTPRPTGKDGHRQDGTAAAPSQDEASSPDTTKPWLAAYVEAVKLRRGPRGT